MNLIRTVCIERGNSEGYGTVREGSGGFGTLFFLTCQTILPNRPNHFIRLEIRTVRILIRMTYVLMRSSSLGSDQYKSTHGPQCMHMTSEPYE